MDEAHTGKYSMQLGGTNQKEGDFLVGACFLLSNTVAEESQDQVPYKLKDRDCTGRFSPETYLQKDERYILSYWRKLENPTYAPMVNYPQVRHSITINNSPVNTLSVREGKMIDTWQKVDVVFEVPQNASGELVLSFYNNHGSAKAYLDDIRVHPFHATAQTYAYDPSTYRLMAELDENNYATFYEYDAEGILARVKKETPRGIMTLREHRNSLSKN